MFDLEKDGYCYSLNERNIFYFDKKKVRSFANFMTKCIEFRIKNSKEENPAIEENNARHLGYFQKLKNYDSHLEDWALFLDVIRSPIIDDEINYLDQLDGVKEVQTLLSSLKKGKETVGYFLVPLDDRSYSSVSISRSSDDSIQGGEIEKRYKGKRFASTRSTDTYQHMTEQSNGSFKLTSYDNISEGFDPNMWEEVHYKPKEVGGITESRHSKDSNKSSFVTQAKLGSPLSKDTDNMAK